MEHDHADPARTPATGEGPASPGGRRGTSEAIPAPRGPGLIYRLNSIIRVDIDAGGTCTRLAGAVPQRSIRRPEEFVGRKYWEGPEDPAWFRAVTWMERALVESRRLSALRERHEITLPTGETTIHDARVRYVQGRWSIACVDLRPGTRALRLGMGQVLTNLRGALADSLEGCVIDASRRIWWWPPGLEAATGIVAGTMLGRRLPAGPELGAMFVWPDPIPLRTGDGRIIASLMVLQKRARASTIAL